MSKVTNIAEQHTNTLAIMNWPNMRTTSARCFIPSHKGSARRAARARVAAGGMVINGSSLPCRPCRRTQCLPLGFLFSQRSPSSPSRHRGLRILGRLVIRLASRLSDLSSTNAGVFLTVKSSAVPATQLSYQSQLQFLLDVFQRHLLLQKNVSIGFAGGPTDAVENFKSGAYQLGEVC